MQELKSNMIAGVRGIGDWDMKFGALLMEDLPPISSTVANAKAERKVQPNDQLNFCKLLLFIRLQT